MPSALTTPPLPISTTCCRLVYSQRVRQISSVQKVCVCARALRMRCLMCSSPSPFLIELANPRHSNHTFQPHHFSLTILFCLSTAISQLNAAKAASMHEQEEVGPGGAGSGKAHSGSYCLFGIKTENPCEKPVDFVKWVLS
jgi:hypothetical protein